jgi:hypothetical protein
MRIGISLPDAFCSMPWFEAAEPASKRADEGRGIAHGRSAEGPLLRQASPGTPRRAPGGARHTPPPAAELRTDPPPSDRAPSASVKPPGKAATDPPALAALRSPRPMSFDIGPDSYAQPCPCSLHADSARILDRT